MQQLSAPLGSDDRSGGRAPRGREDSARIPGGRQKISHGRATGADLSRIRRIWIGPIPLASSVITTAAMSNQRRRLVRTSKSNDCPFRLYSKLSEERGWTLHSQSHLQSYGGPLLTTVNTHPHQTRVSGARTPPNTITRFTVRREHGVPQATGRDVRGRSAAGRWRS